jgi:hypothetical protein
MTRHRARSVRSDHGSAARPGLARTPAGPGAPRERPGARRRPRGPRRVPLAPQRRAQLRRNRVEPPRPRLVDTPRGRYVTRSLVATTQRLRAPLRDPAGSDWEAESNAHHRNAGVRDPGVARGVHRGMGRTTDALRSGCVRKAATSNSPAAPEPRLEVGWHRRGTDVVEPLDPPKESSSPARGSVHAASMSPLPRNVTFMAM